LKRPVFLNINLVIKMILTVFAELSRRNNDFTNTICQLSQKMREIIFGVGLFDKIGKDDILNKLPLDSLLGL